MRKFSNSYLISLIVIWCVFTCISCGEVLNIGIGEIKNNTHSDLVGASWHKTMDDTMLCNERLNLNYYIQPGLSESLTTRPDKGNLRELPDSVKEFIYIFNADTLDKYMKLKLCNGLVNRCLVKKIEIQLNNVRGDGDTVFINTDKPLFNVSSTRESQ